jgi:hypothetical protein
VVLHNRREIVVVESITLYADVRTESAASQLIPDLLVKEGMRDLGVGAAQNRVYGSRYLLQIE